MKDFGSIVRRNFFQPIVIAILILALTLLLLGERRDAWFVSAVILINTIFAIVQELRARWALKKLELINRPQARRINQDGTVSQVGYDELKPGDQIDVRLGDELPADGKVISSQGLEVDESMLTGESVAVDKPADSQLFASSAVVAGSAIVQVLAVGQNTRVGKINHQLKRYVPQSTPLQKIIATVISFMTYGALALAALIFVVYSLMGEDPVKIVKTITSAAVTVVPEGLLLASTLLLAFGSLKLAQAKVLPQKLAAIEAMALIDVLCVDKTGTLTSDEIQFDELILSDSAPKNAAQLIGVAALETSSGNATGDAMISGLAVPLKYSLVETLAFSSERKFSGVRLKLAGDIQTVLIGAPEFLSKIAPLDTSWTKQLKQLTSRGKRVLLAAIVDDSTTSLKTLKANSGQVLGLIVLSNELRKGVVSTINFLQNHNVKIKVISGDNLDTVRSVAEQAGINDSQKAITGASLAKLKGKKWRQAVQQTTVFARILPEQKEQLVAEFKRSGSFVSMIGDGVNDALALKKADLGVAMFAGAVASRRVADIVLLNNSFNALPLGIRLGNRIMLAIEMIATLFFHKIIYGVILLISTILLGVVYPFEPRHVTFMNIFLVTMPTILWTVFTPIPTYKIQPRKFLWDTLLPVLPIAIISGLAVALSYFEMLRLHPENPQSVATTTVLIATLFGVYLVFLVGKMFRVVNNKISRLARLLYILLVSLVVIISFGFGFLRDFFDFTTPAWRNLWPLLLMILFAAGLQWLIADQVAKSKLKYRRANRNNLS